MVDTILGVILVRGGKDMTNTPDIVNVDDLESKEENYLKGAYRPFK